MAAYFQLIIDGKPATFASIDDALRAHFKAPPSTRDYYLNWYDTVGFALAMGRTFDEIRDWFPRQAEVATWIEQHCTVDAWHSK